MKKALDDAKKAVQETGQLLGHYQTRIDSLTKELQAQKTRIGWLQSQLTQQTATYVSPLMEDLSLIHARKTQTLQAMSELDMEEKQRRYTIKLQDESLPILREEREKFQTKLKDLQSMRGRSGERIEAFLSHFNGFMRRTASIQFKSASWDSSEFLPLINEQAPTKALTGFDLAISVLGFHYALLALKVEPPKYDTAHPGLLIVDEPQQQMMESHQYEAIMHLLVDLTQNHSDETQVIVAATNIEKFLEYLQPIEKAGGNWT
ncbi:MAG: hypothetical protein PHQ40_07725 [Anaerolineaceae bacterium]|nr:hypothetical protein [Anaerolineaceae bacterium]